MKSLDELIDQYLIPRPFWDEEATAKQIRASLHGFAHAYAAEALKEAERRIRDYQIRPAPGKHSDYCLAITRAQSAVAALREELTRGE